VTEENSMDHELPKIVSVDDAAVRKIVRGNAIRMLQLDLTP
jgi:hypothetical protein